MVIHFYQFNLLTCLIAFIKLTVKNMIFWRKIVIFHTKYPKIFRASLRSAQFFLSAPPPNLKSWIRP
jgi:hypothetical protein